MQLKCLTGMAQEQYGPFFVWSVELNEELKEMGAELYEAYKIIPNLVNYINTMYKQGVSPSNGATMLLELIEKRQNWPEEVSEHEQRWDASVKHQQDFMDRSSSSSRTGLPRLLRRFRGRG